MRWKSGVEILQVPWQMSMFLKKIGSTTWAGSNRVLLISCHINIYQVVSYIYMYCSCYGFLYIDVL